ncbi:hypothetical protein [Nocardia sp. NPDC051981]|uniref:hypothetical protein n=1 Tax=Nocardia sp. NPDC051981 TaxID=3155417 RepID=UPI00342DF36D
MSTTSDFLSQPGFWWGVPAGAIIAGTIGPYITARSVRASDRRKAEQEVRMDERKALRENRQSNQKILRETATAFGEACSSVIEKAIDSKAIFNAVRDAAVTAAGIPDEKEQEKIEFATDLMDEAKKVTTSYNNLRVVAPVAVLEKAVALNTAIIALTRATTLPLSRPPLMNQASLAFEAYTNSVRAELDLEAFTADDTSKAAATYLETLKRQVDEYIKETKDQARRLGFLEPDSVADPSDGSFEIVPPGALRDTAIKAGALTQEHVGKHLGCHDTKSGFNYGAKILQIRRDEASERPGMLLKILHPPFPDGRPEREEQLRMRFSQDLQLLDLPAG